MQNKCDRAVGNRNVETEVKWEETREGLRPLYTAGHKAAALLCAATTTQRMKILSKKWFNMNGEVDYKEILGCPNKAMIIYQGRYLDKMRQMRGTCAGHVGAPGKVMIWRLEQA